MMRLITAAALGLSVSAMALAAPVIAQQPTPAATAPAPVRYTAQQFYETTSIAMASPEGRAFSADGSSLLYSSDASGVFNVWTMPLGGGAPVQITQSTDNATFAVSYLPGDRILYAADQGGNELDHIYVREADGSVRDLTPGETLKAEFLGLSADGATMFVSTNERDPQMFDVYAYDTASYERRMVFQNNGFFPSSISTDGRWLALDKPLTSANSDVYLADLNAGPTAEPRLVTAHEGNVQHGVHDFAPDGSALVYSTDAHGEFGQAWTYPLGGGEPSALVTGNWDIMFVMYSPSGRYRVHALNADASTEITIMDTTTGQELALTGIPAGDLGGMRFNADESRVAFTVASDTSPADIFVADLSTGAAQRMTHNINPAIDEAQLADGEVVRFASYDGLEVPGILYRPREASAANPVPSLVWVHGGPGGQSRRGYSATIQHLVNNGYAVYAINNRGSSGYGKTFFHMDDRRHGDVDLRDVTSAAGFLQGLDWIDDERTAVVGGSYGGYIVAAAMAFHPDAFDAGIDIFGVTNWVRTLESIPAWWGAQRDALYDEMGDPATDAERHRAISPLFHAGNIRRPLMVIQGANDPRVLQVESDELVAAVRANNVPVDYVIFPDEGHGFLRKENRITASEGYLRFLDQYLRD